MKDLGPVPDNAIMVTADVVGLYPSIPHDEGLDALKDRLEKRVDKKVPTADLVKMADFVLSNNFFEFDSETYHQISGTAIGTKFAPTFACIFMDKFETDFLSEQPIQPWIWLRYIDDIFFIWTGSNNELDSFLERLNQFHPSIKFTSERSRETINFLDVNVKLEGNTFATDLTKETDSHQFLHFASSHPLHMKKSSVYSQGLRIRRLCSADDTFLLRLSQLSEWFKERCYPQNIINNELAKVKNKLQEETLRPTEKSVKESGVPFVLTFHPMLERLGSVMAKLLPLLKVDEELRKAFAVRPFVSFRSCSNLRNKLVRAKLYPLERTFGSSRCGNSRCEVCNNLTVAKTFKSSITGSTTD